MGPESPVKKNETEAIFCTNSSIEVLPARLDIFFLPDSRNKTSISLAVSISFIPPKITTSNSSDKLIATLAKLSGNQHLADPYVAPGLIPKVGLIFFFGCYFFMYF